MRGDGHIFKRGRIYWYKYYVRGIEHRETLRTTNPNVAERRAKKIRDGIIEGVLLPAGERRVLTKELLDDFEADMHTRGLASIDVARRHLVDVHRQFDSVPAAAVDTATVQAYQKRALARDPPLAPATINRRCEYLRGAFLLAFNRTPRKVSRVPYVPMLPVNNARQGFISTPDFYKILGAVEDPDLADFLEWFWWSAMRPNEIRNLTWPMLDEETWTINLDPAVEKTRNPRILPLRSSRRKLNKLGEVMKRRQDRRRTDTPLIFHRQFQGKTLQVGSLRDVWKAACAAVGLSAGRKVSGGLTPYDLRRSALRNLVRAGVDITTAMRISGHKTRATFDRYNIVDESDVRDALDASAKYVAAQRRKR